MRFPKMVVRLAGNRQCGLDRCSALACPAHLPLRHAEREQGITLVEAVTQLAVHAERGGQKVDGGRKLRELVGSLGEVTQQHRFPAPLAKLGKPVLDDTAATRKGPASETSAEPEPAATEASQV